jgi:hypothetical protein
MTRFGTLLLAVVLWQATAAAVSTTEVDEAFKTSVVNRYVTFHTFHKESETDSRFWGSVGLAGDDVYSPSNHSLSFQQYLKVERIPLFDTQ